MRKGGKRKGKAGVDMKLERTIWMKREISLIFLLAHLVGLLLTERKGKENSQSLALAISPPALGVLSDF